MSSLPGVKLGRCIYCNNKGPTKEGEVCKCGRIKEKLNLDVESEELVGKIIRTSNKLGIAAEYIGTEWSEELFWAMNGLPPSDTETHPLRLFIKTLGNIHSIFARGELPDGSALIIAPSTFSKATWAHSCMTHAIKHGYSVAPFLDTMEVNRLLTVTAQIPKYKYYNKLDPERYIMNDVLFMSVVKGPLRWDAWSVILDVLSKRSRKGLPTFITSSCSVIEMSKNDTSGDFRRLTKRKGGENRLKVPQLVTYNDLEVGHD